MIKEIENEQLGNATRDKKEKNILCCDVSAKCGKETRKKSERNEKARIRERPFPFAEEEG